MGKPIIVAVTAALLMLALIGAAPAPAVAGQSGSSLLGPGLGCAVALPHESVLRVASDVIPGDVVRGVCSLMSAMDDAVAGRGLAG